MLDDPEVAGREYYMPAGRVTVGESISRFGTGDVLVHTWDLARATGQDETLDPDEVHRLLDGMVAMEGPMRASGHYGPQVEVPAGPPHRFQRPGALTGALTAGTTSVRAWMWGS